MTEYTTDDVMHEVLWSKLDEVKPEYQRAFEKWLAEVERAAAEKAWDEGFDAGERDAIGHETFDEPCVANPYRRNEGANE